MQHRLLSYCMTPCCWALKGPLRSFPVPGPLQPDIEYYERSVNRHFQSHHGRSSHRHPFTVDAGLVRLIP